MIAVLLTVHNRRDTTLACLQALYASSVHGRKAASSDDNAARLFDVYLVDDGSTDGTAEAVAAAIPAVRIIAGDGTLFWNGGMRKAWQAAAAAHDYDHYLWLNDDTMLHAHALETLLETSRAHDDRCIVVGTTSATDDSSEITYGGRTEAGLIQPADHVQACDFFNGNIALVPRYAFLRTGMHDKRFRHALGDFDYGLRAAKLGIGIVVAPGVLGTCDEHLSPPTWCDGTKPLAQRWRAMRTPTGHNPEEFFRYTRRHYGLPKACLHYITNHLRVLFPKLWK